MGRPRWAGRLPSRRAGLLGRAPRLRLGHACAAHGPAGWAAPAAPVSARWAGTTTAGWLGRWPCACLGRCPCVPPGPRARPQSRPVCQSWATTEATRPLGRFDDRRPSLVSRVFVNLVRKYTCEINIKLCRCPKRVKPVLLSFLNHDLSNSVFCSYRLGMFLR